jgi:hypothetical protein
MPQAIIDGTPAPLLRSAGCITIYRDPAALLAGYADSPLAREA